MVVRQLKGEWLNSLGIFVVVNVIILGTFLWNGWISFDSGTSKKTKRIINMGIIGASNLVALAATLYYLFGDWAV